jgi:hypothetical protein
MLLLRSLDRPSTPNRERQIRPKRIVPNGTPITMTERKPRRLYSAEDRACWFDDRLICPCDTICDDSNVCMLLALRQAGWTAEPPPNQPPPPSK